MKFNTALLHGKFSADEKTGAIVIKNRPVRPCIASLSSEGGDRMRMHPSCRGNVVRFSIHKLEI